MIFGQFDSLPLTSCLIYKLSVVTPHSYVCFTVCTASSIELMLTVVPLLMTFGAKECINKFLLIK